MVLSPSLRKIVLTVHVTSSVAWLGAVAGFLALAFAGLTSREPQMALAAYIAMGLITWFVIVPLTLASLVTGIASSLGTGWGLFRYYWVVVKLLITSFATIVLLVHLQPIQILAATATRAGILGAELHQTRLLMLVASSAAFVALLVLTTLSVYKPRGTTSYGARKQLGYFQSQRRA
jgi:hypothetical protein